MKKHADLFGLRPSMQSQLDAAEAGHVLEQIQELAGAEDVTPYNRLRMMARMSERLPQPVSTVMTPVIQSMIPEKVKPAGFDIKKTGIQKIAQPGWWVHPGDIPPNTAVEENMPVFPQRYPPSAEVQRALAPYERFMRFVRGGGDPGGEALLDWEGYRDQLNKNYVVPHYTGRTLSNLGAIAALPGKAQPQTLPEYRRVLDEASSRVSDIPIDMIRHPYERALQRTQEGFGVAEKEQNVRRNQVLPEIQKSVIKGASMNEQDLQVAELLLRIKKAHGTIEKLSNGETVVLPKPPAPPAPSLGAGERFREIAGKTLTNIQRETANLTGEPSTPKSVAKVHPGRS